MTIQAFYQNIQGDYADALHRFLTEDRLRRAVKSFLFDETYAKLMNAVGQGDVSASFESAHKLKGIAGSLAFTQLYRALSDLLEELRLQAAPAEPALVERISLCYRTVADEITHLENGADRAEKPLCT